MEVRGERIILDASEWALLELACRGDSRPQLTRGDFARWLHKPCGDDMLAMANGARLALGAAFEKACVARTSVCPADAGPECCARGGGYSDVVAHFQCGALASV
ncbi:hypothetical protein [Niveibacterium sp. COAC-50]|uniref:hypothetical protein n=1 Tax=Niveibacterium sp. COAC-50 TaxID=2729384 RepID=UPI001557BEE9|nr:hypothetical protein [Niveibacterium sp. COAC-50]